LKPRPGLASPTSLRPGRPAGREACRGLSETTLSGSPTLLDITAAPKVAARLRRQDAPDAPPWALGSRRHSGVRERIRGEPAARRPTKAPARRLKAPSRGSAYASPGLSSRPPRAARQLSPRQSALGGSARPDAPCHRRHSSAFEPVGDESNPAVAYGGRHCDRRVCSTPGEALDLGASVSYTRASLSWGLVGCGFGGYKLLRLRARWSRRR
jgi:hypothetical protein